MKILQYNVLEGWGTKERYAAFSSWLKGQDYDVIGFNELNNWTDTEFKKEMKKCGYPYSCLFEMDSSPFYIGITSKFPIEKVNMTEAIPFHHGLLHVKTNGIHFIVIHLSPFESERRENETKQIAAYIEPIKAPLVLMGDFNTLSPLDQENYEKGNTVEQIKLKRNLVRQHIREGEINFLPMQTLLQAGLHDVGFSETLDYSMPTKYHQNMNDPVYLRIDYVLVNAILLDKKPKASIIRNADVSRLSDHYPIECKWNDTN